MANQRGERTTLRVAGVTAGVSLVKQSAKPTGARYEVRREATPAPASVEVGSVTATWPTVTGDPFGPNPETVLPADEPDPVDPPAPKRSEARHGVTVDGEWVDLTDQLAAIDRRTMLDGLEVLFTLRPQSVPRNLVRGAYFIVPQDQEAADVLRRLCVGLAGEGMGAVVRWTKRTNQALGFVQASGRVLHLLELEWSANVRDVPTPAVLATQSVPTSGVESARRLVRALAGSSADLTAVRDERMTQRAQLLEAARRGEEWVAPEAPVASVPEADVFAASVGA